MKQTQCIKQEVQINYVRMLVFFCCWGAIKSTMVNAQNAYPITLESKLLNLIDGSFINADRIEEIQRFRYKLLALLLGDYQSDGTRIGKYLFEGTLHTVQTLYVCETERGEAFSQEFIDLLEHGKEDFLALSDEFRSSARGSKTFTVQLIEDSCKKRGRMNSTLLTWAHTTLEKERDVFKREVTNFAKLTLFLTDLFNFLTDLQHSCPKAVALFNNRVAKYTAIKKLLPEEGEKYGEPIDKRAFLAHFKRKWLDKLTLEEITPQTVHMLVKAFTQAT